MNIAESTYCSNYLIILALAAVYSAGSRILIASKFKAQTLLMNTFFKFSCIMCLFLS